MTAPRVLSVNVGLPRELEWRGQAVTTSIFKEPVEGPVRVGALNLEGDRQADLSVHGGWEKAVYVYPSEHYERWRSERPGLELGSAAFGENLTTEGLLDEEVSVGDRLGIGSAEFVVTEPRLPCFKLGIKMGRDEFVREFLERGLLGFYLAVARQGELAPGDEIRLLSRQVDGFAVTEIARLYARDRDDVEGLRRAATLDAVPESWRSYFREQLTRLERRHQTPLLPPAPPPVWEGFRPFTVSEKRLEAEGVASLRLEPADGEPLAPYRPGQHLTISLAMPGTGEAAIRSYSLSDSPRPGSYRLTVKRIAQDVAGGQPGGVSSCLHEHVRTGDIIDVKAPAGQFTLDPRETHRPVVLIAGGIGVTPILSMLNAIVEQRGERETWVFYGVRNHREHIMREHLERIAENHSHIQLHVCYSRPARRRGATVGSFQHARRVGPELLKELLPASYYDFFLCGPPAMMRSLYDGLRDWGVPDHRIHYEAFGPAGVKAKAPDPDAQPDCGVQVNFARSQLTTVWSRCGSPLLELAEDNGIAIPFGCRAGSCGTCATRVLSGQLTYLHPPGAPLADGECLPCIAVPTTPVSLDV